MAHEVSQPVDFHMAVILLLPFSKPRNGPDIQPVRFAKDATRSGFRRCYWRSWPGITGAKLRYE